MISCLNEGILSSTVFYNIGLLRQVTEALLDQCLDIIVYILPQAACAFGNYVLCIMLGKGYRNCGE